MFSQVMPYCVIAYQRGAAALRIRFTFFADPFADVAAVRHNLSLPVHRLDQPMQFTVQRRNTLLGLLTAAVLVAELMLDAGEFIAQSQYGIE